MPPAQLDSLVQPIALYPDPLLAQVLTASTYWDQIPGAARWADAHSYLNGDALANAIQEDQAPWDPSVLALLPFSSVLDQMAGDPGWTQSLGNAVLTSRPEVMDAIQRMRMEAMNYGYLQSNQYYRVTSGPYIEILPVTPGYFYVPRYNPAVIFTRPRRPVQASIVLNFGPRIQVGAAFAPLGWRQPGFAWNQHNIVINNQPWVRNMQNREHYQPAYKPPVRQPETKGRTTYVEHHQTARGREQNAQHGKKGEHGKEGGRGKGNEHR
jgi:Protein of unknown function (DUF3300)